ncbi:hypothetical protein ZWY2020_012548 [Hordeum vulgare]|nr:hypothetical protein ZWY2020_012548 [Hordeum vulgare]
MVNAGYDNKRFRRYLAEVEAGNVKIAAGALLPHEILASAKFDAEVANLQWKRMVDDLLAMGRLNNCCQATCAQLHHVAGDTLWDKAQFIQRMDWQTNTDFQAVFDQLLHVAVAGNLAPESMVKKVTDMTILATARLQQRKG